MDIKKLIPFLKAAVNFLVASLSAVIKFLDDHSGAVLAIVTAVYAFFTWCLWRSTERLWQETKRQADFTRDTFNAAYRPHVSVGVKNPERSQEEVWSCGLILRNSGMVPAIITNWKHSAAVIEQEGQERTIFLREADPASFQLEGLQLGPHQPQTLILPLGDRTSPRDPAERLVVRVELEYRGTTLTAGYRASTEVVGTLRGWEERRSRNWDV